MTFLLAAINAKYIHSNLAVFSLAAYAREKGLKVETAEYTINHQKEYILRSIYEKKPDVLGFSCYIWNMEYVTEIARELHKLLPGMPIWLGGPEVTWNAAERLRDMPYVTGIMIGEGEETMRELAAAYEAAGKAARETAATVGKAARETEVAAAGNAAHETEAIATGKATLETIAQAAFATENSPSQGILPQVGQALLQKIPGLCIRTEQGPVFTAPREVLDMDDIPFPYGALEDYENRIIYYESSRGCPFQCSYCLSSVEKKLRFRSLSKVLPELDFFLKEGVAQVKFVDRTFNCRHEHAYAIWEYITAHDNGKTNFHFEISADLLKEEDFLLFAKMRPGLIQLETGVQTTNPDTIKAIGRQMNLEKVRANTLRIKAFHNIHQHLDLIAGLPEEGLESFQKSFDDVYVMQPDELQLGFLKVLHGTSMEEKAKEYGLIYQDTPVYEVMESKWLPYEDLLYLKDVEDAVEVYYNSNQFANTLPYLISYFKGAFDFYGKLGSYRKNHGILAASRNRMEQYQILRDFALDEKPEVDADILAELLTYDYCLREKLKKIPDFLPDQEPYKKLISDFYAEEVSSGTYFGPSPAKGQGAYRQLRGSTQAVVLPKKGELVLFDYNRRSPLDHNGTVIKIPLSELG